ncbi:MAG: prepilin-type N-terminal cleavage/methylation domain-containing protein [Acidobacteria bacterium]|nr:prepilin-type N-terminal cleavage/methylation domain-containing protein [Acidobacteriota bacterium]
MKNRAFSLMEVLIVLVILGLLISLVAPRALERLHKAKYQTSIINLKAIANAMEQYQTEHGKYPVFNSWTEVSAPQSPLREYVTEIPTGDNWGRPFHAKSSETDYLFSGEAIPKPKMALEYPAYSFVPGPTQLKGTNPQRPPQQE